MKLLLDAGNTRIKWRLVEPTGERVAAGAWCWEQEPDLPPASDLGAGPGSVHAVCVAGGLRRESLSALIMQRYTTEVVYAQSLPQQCGVTNSYADVSRMGADRWLAMIAAYQEVAGASVVIDAGTAITVDGLDASGRHLGGFIMPGLAMLRASLLQGTKEVRVEREVAALTPGTDTETAVGHGCLLMAAAACDRAVAQFAGGRVLIAGGDAGLLVPVLQVSAEQRAELVLEGLRCVSETAATGAGP